MSGTAPFLLRFCDASALKHSVQWSTRLSAQCYLAVRGGPATVEVCALLNLVVLASMVFCGAHCVCL